MVYFVDADVQDRYSEALLKVLIDNGRLVMKDYLGIDHGRTLACIQPRLLRFNFESKKEKLAQMGRRVFNLEGTDEEVASKAIDAIVDFYEKDMKVPTHISAYDPDGDRKWVDAVEKK